MYLPILTYHRLLTAEPTKTIDPKRIAVSQKQFRKHLRWLSNFGYTTTRLDHYGQELKRKGKRVGGKTFAITFDDAYEEVCTLGLPVLQEFGFTATVFVVAQEQTNRWDDGSARLMNPAQCRQWKNAGMEIGSHSSHHAHLSQIDLAQARQEIVESKSILESTLGAPVTTFAYPYGESCPDVEKLVEEAGYDAAFSTDRAPQDHAANRFTVRRAVVFPRNTAWEILMKAQRWYPRYQDFKRRYENRRHGDTEIRVPPRPIVTDITNAPASCLSPRIPASPRLHVVFSLWAPVLVWAALIFSFSSIPDLRITQAWYDIILRKMAHLFVFGALARLIARALTESTFWSWKKIFYASLALTFLYAITDEVHQSYVPGRHGALLDIGIDTLGACLALGVKPD